MSQVIDLTKWCRECAVERPCLCDHMDAQESDAFERYQQEMRDEGDDSYPSPEDAA